MIKTIPSKASDSLSWSRVSFSTLLMLKGSSMILLRSTKNTFSLIRGKYGYKTLKNLKMSLIMAPLSGKTSMILSGKDLVLSRSSMLDCLFFSFCFLSSTNPAKNLLLLLLITSLANGSLAKLPCVRVFLASKRFHTLNQITLE
ncbi:hypothetical protein WICPIJ_000212 [Wickerhamomyces pijperi]|uniref:Uncharacterized protein n=1 Tax=Wickerhamomyces pijperi TaxID=599730 RepID=A0A9P8QH12_WICPI|nr:hypothetical protein WICPIJ_000212 [Wickerhamomyces pijperi]